MTIEGKRSLDIEQPLQKYLPYLSLEASELKKTLPALALELAARLIRMFSFVGDTVLDPFVGTGTTNVAAAQWGDTALESRSTEGILIWSRSGWKRRAINSLATSPSRSMSAEGQ